MQPQTTIETILGQIEATADYVQTFRPLCDISAELGAWRVVPQATRRAFLADSSALLDYARSVKAPRWLVRELREQCGRAHILAAIAASN